MKKRIRLKVTPGCALAYALACAAAAAAATPQDSSTAGIAFADPLDIAAAIAQAPASQTMIATARAGTRLVAAGMRGLIIASDDAGASWQQQPAPVQSDLTALSFATPLLGWAAGHDGVILHSTDGGRSWSKQLDGRIAADTFVRYYRQRIDAGDRSLEADLAELQRNFQSGPALPYLDVHFENASTGYAVGSFGMLAATDDGGQTWVPALERIDNPDFLNLNAIRSINGVVYIAGERGMIYRLDPASRRFVRSSTGYAGSFFGICGDAETVVAFGLRGTVYRSTDGGIHWLRSETPAAVTITGGDRNNSGQILLATQGAGAWIGSGDMARFAPLALEQPDAFTAVTALDGGRMLLAGLGGIRIQALRQ